ncbi:hypothetical protein [Acidovorax sp. MR-S7]|jgi:DNA repair exonuclease SbcCD ATPase subunit|uniref:hypothetical protein n=1 Tax=Acidovorax sp. MR-S7 TaxID=1268622 RepID=UPI0003D3FFDC|nr:hypothetical protein [Acidovorax sp. MR-S7]GAD23784.1 hypothetical protein AVS7_03544 [Acidovorax sp. MR-S7]
MKRQPLEAFRSAVLLAAMLLAGCGAWAPRAQERPQAVETVPATPPAPPPPAPVQPQPDEETPAAIEPPPLKDILAYAHRAARFTPAELAAELARLTPQQDASAQQQLELALALGQTRQPADTARALALVQRVIARSDGPPAYRALARLLENFYLQQRRLEDQADRQAQQVRELQRKTDQLNERLEAMRAIERSLNTRPPTNGR